MRRYGPEVVDLAFKMRCFGNFVPQNSKKLCFSLLKQCLHHETRWRQQHDLRASWDQDRGVEEEEIEEHIEAGAVGEPNS
jgi:hypothetical protein